MGGPGLMLIALADSSFLSIPQGNEILIVILSIGQTWGKMLYYVLMTTLGSLIGCSILFLIARKGGELFLRKQFSDEKIELARKWFQKNDFFMILIPSTLPPPTPFKLFVISSAIFGLSVHRFVLAVFIGRGIRYLIWGTLTVLYGAAVRDYMEKNLYTIGIVLLAFFLLGFGVLVVYFLNKASISKRASARRPK